MFPIATNTLQISTKYGHLNRKIGKNVTIEATTPEEVLESWTPERINGQDTPDYKLVGTYSNKAMNQGDYYIGTKDGETAFFRVNNTAKTMKAFRCYITPASGAGGAKALEGMDFEDPILEEQLLLESMDLTGIATGLDEVEAPAATPATGVYNIAGQRMHDDAQLPAGIYIINGKKTIVK